MAYISSAWSKNPRSRSNTHRILYRTQDRIYDTMGAAALLNPSRLDPWDYISLHFSLTKRIGPKRTTISMWYNEGLKGCTKYLISLTNWSQRIGRALILYSLSRSPASTCLSTSKNISSITLEIRFRAINQTTSENNWQPELKHSAATRDQYFFFDRQREINITLPA